MDNNKKVAFYTLGCKLNYAETATIERQFLEKGFSSVQFSEKADVYVINTCSVTSHADKKCRNIIKKAVKNAPGSFVAVVGCYSQLQSEQLAAIPGVDLVLGSREKLKMFDYVKDFSKKEQAEVHSCEILKMKEFDSSYSVSGRTRSFVKIQDGCDYFCSYCTIPLARGLSRSNTIERVLEDVKEVAAKGAKEVVLTGVNIGDFGKGSDDKLIDLVKELEKIGGIERFRISSIEPNLLTNEIIEFMSGSKKFVPHFHIPLQAGCDKILKLMNLKWTPLTVYNDHFPVLRSGNNFAVCMRSSTFMPAQVDARTHAAVPGSADTIPEMPACSRTRLWTESATWAPEPQEPHYRKKSLLNSDS